MHWIDGGNSRSKRAHFRRLMWGGMRLEFVTLQRGFSEMDRKPGLAILVSAGAALRLVGTRSQTCRAGTYECVPSTAWDCVWELLWKGWLCLSVPILSS